MIPGSASSKQGAVLSNDELRRIEKRAELLSSTIGWRCFARTEHNHPIADDLKALLAEVKRLRAMALMYAGSKVKVAFGLPWIPCELSLPEEGKVVWTSARGDMAAGVRENGKWWFVPHCLAEGRMQLCPAPDHWQQLPEPPENA